MPGGPLVRGAGVPCGRQRGDSEPAAHGAEGAGRPRCGPDRTSGRSPAPGDRESGSPNPLPDAAPRGVLVPAALHASDRHFWLYRVVLAFGGGSNCHHLGWYQGCLAMSHRFTTSSLRSTPPHAEARGMGRRTDSERVQHLSMNPAARTRNYLAEAVPMLRNSVLEQGA